MICRLSLAIHHKHVAQITINNLREAFNAMTRDMMRELGRRSGTIWSKAIVAQSCLTGAGEKAFSAGADVSGDLSASEETARK